jgi:hypothetical protein
MSIVTLFTRKSPTIGGFEFDAVLEDTFEASVEYTQYTIEAGASVTDHRIIKPFRWALVGAVSNNPLSPALTDFVTGGLSNFGGGVISTVAGLSAGFLAGSNDTRASDTLLFLLGLMVSGETVDIDAGDIQLSNMVISDLRRIKDAENEGGLIFEAQLQELPTLDTILTIGQPKQDQLREDTPEQSQAAALIDKGEQALKDVGDSINSLVDGVFG